ncbi:alpha/beta hydrolase [Chryseobacterium pennae]|uniref:Alpha/beta hydrolase n=1 Tax=Chryseobacterium pennae TaxID=2258962 RepID=A0A3D9CD71_9FLAO|nr:alpha/beta hydrolase [Chryseobacterium pennae]REC63727.1 alpha/beta hydrolase [Chryseobacterium pennae]
MNTIIVEENFYLRKKKTTAIFLIKIYRNYAACFKMKYIKSFIPLSSLLFLLNCSVKKNITSSNEYEVKRDTLTLLDPSRNRKIPVAYYLPKTNKKIQNQQVIIFNHGYGFNKGGDYFVYSYSTETLASKGYFTVSIQHEQTTDSPLPVEGNLQMVRRPFWQNGSDNILYVLNELKKTKPDLDYKIIAMDNRRMLLPRTSIPKIYSLRSNDYPADEGVLPTEEEQKKISPDDTANHYQS